MQFLGVDTGGTFTDFVLFDGDNYKIHKVLSTPDDPSIAIYTGTNHFENLSLKIVKLIHGTTVATNALLERKGAKVLLLTTKGFEDVIEIGRQNRGKLYDLFWKKRPLLVLKENRIGISERIDSSGNVLKELNTEEINELIKILELNEYDTISVCFINSYVNPDHELIVEKILNNLDIPISLSSKVMPEFREFERTSTTVANSYLIPKVRDYMNSLGKKLKGADVYVMQSNGGLIKPKQAAIEPVRIITSGPAGGVVGAYKIAEQIGINKIITYDMGGTSTDISLCDGSLKFTTESVIDGIPIKIPMIDIYTIGAGGGSIAFTDSGGALKVGPQSAGADPGPACYGKGKEPTVTDANLLLGRIQGNNFLGGRMKVDTDLACTSIKKLNKNFGIDEFKIAEMIIKIANSNMERAIKVISVDKGYDPREFTLVSFGGAGGLHACELARDIGIKRIIFPINPGVLSALGMLFADSFKDYSKGYFLDCDDLDFNILETQYKELENRAREEFVNEKIEFERLIDARYKRQSHELTVPYSFDFVKDFHKKHIDIYGFNSLSNVVEIVTIRIRAIIGRSELVLPKL
ncbi:MAG: hydantoinase/oxoprolinase family protein, partial [Thermodesulfobacteriota bacterium]